MNRLQEENRRIKQNDSYTHSGDTGDTKQVPKNQAGALNLLNESDFQKMKRLRGQMEKQRDELMCRDQEIEEKNTEIENVRTLIHSRRVNAVNHHFCDFFQFNIQLERLKNSGRESRKRQKLLQTQVRTLLEERSDLLMQIQDQNREISVLRRSLGFGGNDQLDLKTASSAECSQLSKDDLKPLILERDSLKAKLKQMENELKQFKASVESGSEATTVDDEKTPEKTPEKSV